MCHSSLEGADEQSCKSKVQKGNKVAQEVYATFFGRKAAFASVTGEKVSEDRLTGDSAPGMYST